MLKTNVSINILSIKISAYTHTQRHHRLIYTFTGNVNKMDPHSFSDNTLNTDIWKPILQLLFVVAPITFPSVCPKAKCSR